MFNIAQNVSKYIVFPVGSIVWMEFEIAIIYTKLSKICSAFKENRRAIRVHQSCLSLVFFSHMLIFSL